MLLSFFYWFLTVSSTSPPENGIKDYTENRSIHAQARHHDPPCCSSSPFKCSASCISMYHGPKEQCVIDWDCCSKKHRCNLGKGDCDYDSDCRYPFKCSTNSGLANGYKKRTVDVCSHLPHFRLYSYSHDRKSHLPMCDINFHTTSTLIFDYPCQPRRATAFNFYHAKKGEIFVFFDDPQMRPSTDDELHILFLEDYYNFDGFVNRESDRSFHHNITQNLEVWNATDEERTSAGIFFGMLIEKNKTMSLNRQDRSPCYDLMDPKTGKRVAIACGYTYNGQFEQSTAARQYAGVPQWLSGLGQFMTGLGAAIVAVFKVYETFEG